MLRSYLIYRKYINKSTRKCVYCLTATLVFLFVITDIAFSQYTVPVLFSGPVDKRNPLKIYLDGVFVGNMGDSINAPLGKHFIEIKGPYGASLNMNLNFGIGRIGNSGVEVQNPSCWNHFEYVKSWPWHYQPLHNRTIIHIKNPVIGRRSKLNNCPRYRLNIFRKLGKVKLSITSKPDGATILIDGKRKGKTPKTLGVIYKENTDLISIVVRKEGYINFTRYLTPPFPDEMIYDCTFYPF